MATVSVVIPSFNMGRFIGQALESVVAQTFPDWQAIVVDDGSTDDSYEIACAFAAREPRIKVLRQKNSGSAGSPRNRGIEASSAPYIAFLDPDDYWSPKKLEAQLAALDRHKEIDLLFEDAELVDESGSPIGTLFSDLNFVEEASTCTEQIEPQLFLCRSSYFVFASCKWTGIQTSGVLVRRTALERLEYLFPTDLRVWEDNDVWWRLMLNGKAAFLNQTLHSYRQHPQGVTQDINAVAPDRIKAHIRNYARAEGLLTAEMRAVYRRRIADEFFYLGWRLKNAGNARAARTAYRRSLHWNWRTKVLLALAKAHLVLTKPRQER